MKQTLATAVMLLGISQAAQAAPSLAETLAQRGLAVGKTHEGLTGLCNLDMKMRVAGKRPEGAERREHEHERGPAAAMPTQVFDNLYFVGNAKVSSWALQTDAGLILIDAMNNNDEAERYIEQGLLDLGLNPDDIRYLVITHAHGDHYGGQQYLVETYAPRVIMSDADWSLLESEDEAVSNPRWGEAPEREMTVQDGETLTLGDTTLAFHVTPGHTPGSLSLIFPVQDGEETHHVGLWGGTGFNFGPDEARLRQYSASAADFRAEAAEAGVDVFLSNHARRDDSVAKLAALAERGEGEPHPYVSDQALGAFDLLSDCSLAQAERLRASRDAKAASSSEDT